MSWILIVSWSVAAGVYEASAYAPVIRTNAIAMQEFGSLDACQFASLEAQKIAKGIRVVCVQKGGGK